jgi:hypothetical protein
MSRAEAWRAYERAFHEFSAHVAHLQNLSTDPHPDPIGIEAALVEVEKARRIYDRNRDALAQLLMPSARRALPTADRTIERVSNIAELLWESAGRPDGTADHDWHRAEDILRRATNAA